VALNATRVKWNLRANEKRPAAVVPGGPREEKSMLLIDPVGTLTFVGLEGLDRVSGLLHRAGHEPADGVILPSHLVHDLGQRGAVFPLQQRDYLSSLAALARSSTFLFLSGLLGFGRVLGWGRLLDCLALRGCALSQILVAPALAVLNLNVVTGTPARLFQIATKRSAGQVLASCASSFELVKNSKAVVIVAVASSWAPNTLMLFSVSMVKIILNLLCSALSAVMTSIPPNRLNGKAILK
jgi:hypothetical protein